MSLDGQEIGCLIEAVFSILEGITHGWKLLAVVLALVALAVVIYFFVVR